MVITQQVYQNELNPRGWVLVEDFSFEKKLNRIEKCHKPNTLNQCTPPFKFEK